VDIQEQWEKALKKTEILRPSVRPLETYQSTQVPYVFLAESSVNRGDTVVRKGEVTVEKPSIVLPFNMPFFEGFEFEKEMEVSEDFLQSFFLVRGIHFPSFRYNNKTSSLDIYEGSLSEAVKHHRERLEREEDARTGMLCGPEGVWPFSVLLFVCMQAHRAAEGDIRRLFEDYRRGL